ncbi:MAG: EAL domain-containing protein [Planctomycetota bacterium]|nr:MAG: EAL domain-containing protein [Planctomycetota bacterium]
MTPWPLLRFRVPVTLGGIGIALAAGLLLSQYRSALRELEQRARQDVRLMLADLQNEWSTGSESLESHREARCLDSLNSRPEVVGVAIFNHLGAVEMAQDLSWRGRRLVNMVPGISPPARGGQEAPSPFEAIPVTGFAAIDGFLRLAPNRNQVSSLDGSSYWAWLRYDLAPGRQAVHRRFTKHAVVVSTSILVAWLLASWWLSRKVTTPLQRLSATAERIGAGDYQAKSGLQGEDEIGRLARSLDKMAGRLATTHQRWKRRNQLYGALSASNKLILRMVEPRYLFEEVCKIAVESTGLAVAVVGRTKCDGKRAGLLARAELAGGNFQSFDPWTKSNGKPENPLLQLALQENRTVVFKNSRNAGRPSFSEVGLEGTGLLSAGAFPLKCSDEVVGVFGAFSRDRNFFCPETISLLEEMVEDLSIALENFEQAQGRKEAEAQVNFLAYYDETTGLANRAGFLKEVNQNLGSGRDGVSALLYLDLDHFRRVNESFGHGAGDRLLVEAAMRIRTSVGKEAIVARLGGDEFGILLLNLAKNRKRAVSEAAKVTEQIEVSLRQPYHLEGRQIRLEASSGVALFPGDGAGPMELLQNAEVGMYEAKEQGRGQYRFYASSMNATAVERLDLELALRQALENQDFCLHYQPQLDLTSNQIIGAEALLRWRHEQRGWISPSVFIPLAEATGLIVPLGWWVLDQACQFIADLQNREQAVSLNRISVNVSARQFQHPDFLPRVQSALLASGAKPDSLVLELTETVLLRDEREALNKFEVLREMGIGLAIDDFGTGYSSLAYLRKLPVAELKIDRSFIRDLPENQNAVAIVRTILAMARFMNVETLAEGVETREQLRVLGQLGCGSYQGFLFSPALEEAEFLRLLHENSKAALPNLSKDGGDDDRHDAFPGN